ncbi:MAG: hypothetical protein HY056_17930 [Proteobacteria bacterium]|nr:hypothetical protein [Pseudomonadota bacterium]
MSGIDAATEAATGAATRTAPPAASQTATVAGGGSGIRVPPQAPIGPPVVDEVFKSELRAVQAVVIDADGHQGKGLFRAALLTRFPERLIQLTDKESAEAYPV